MIRTFSSLILAACALSVAACGPSTTERCPEAKNPTECAQVANAGGDVSDYLVYGMAGYMLSSAINGAGQRQSVIVADPGYHGPRHSIASYQASPARVRRSTTVTTTTRHGPSGTKTTTRTTSWSSRPSYRPATYRSTSYTSNYRGSRR